MAYATVTELKNRLNIDTTDATRDGVLNALLNAASGAIDGYCNRPDGFVADAVASARYYAGSGTPLQMIDECTQITTVSVKDTATDTSYTDWTTPTTDFSSDGDWIPFAGSSDDPQFNRLPYTGIMTDPASGSYDTFTSGKFSTRGGFRPSSGVARNIPTVKVTARWGYADVVPDNVREACIVQAARWYKRGEGSWNDSIATAEFGQMQYRKVLDPDLQAMLMEARLVRPSVLR